MAGQRTVDFPTAPKGMTLVVLFWQGKQEDGGHPKIAILAVKRETDVDEMVNGAREYGRVEIKKVDGAIRIFHPSFGDMEHDVSWLGWQLPVESLVWIGERPLLGGPLWISPIKEMGRAAKLYGRNAFPCAQPVCMWCEYRELSSEDDE